MPTAPSPLHAGAGGANTPRQGISVGSQVLIASGGFALAAAALVFGLTRDHLDGLDAVRAVAHAAAIAIPIATGVYAMGRNQTFRFGRLLVIGGFLWPPIVLATSTDSVTYSVGRVWSWGVLAWLVYLLLSYPLGTLTTRIDRWLVGLAFTMVVVLYLPSTLLTDFPDPSPWAACSADCPANAFALDHGYAGISDLMTGARDLMASVLYLSAAVTVALRLARGSSTGRRVHGPVLVVAGLNFAVSCAFVVARRVAPEATATEVIGLCALLATPALAVACLAGLVRWRLVAVGTWRHLASEGQESLSHDRVRDLLADAIRDPSLEIGYWGGPERTWIDEHGLPFPLPAPGTGRAVTDLSLGSRRVAVLVHEDGYLAESAIREVVQGVALLALDNHRIEAEAHADVTDLSDSRSRIVAGIDRDRLRLERDLHDGAQQRLIALKVAADRGAATAGTQSADVAALFRRIGSEASEALDEVRSLARGVYPSLLVDHGLVAALEDCARRATIPTKVRATGIHRYPQEVEATVYFCCLEALQNAEKHSGATVTTIELASDGELTFEIRDNGRGFALGKVQNGAGIANLKDRVAAVGGDLRVDSVVGVGTRVSGRVPMLPDRVPQEVERLVLRAADALEDALGIYRAVRASSGTIVDFVVEHVNDAAVAMTGVSRENQVGKALGQLQPGYHRSSTFKWHCEALGSRTPLLREEFEHTGSDGRRRLRRAYEMRAVGLGAGRLAVVSRDVTERARIEHQQRLHAEALGQERDGVCIVRAASGTIVYANQSLEEMFVYGKGELEGRPASVLDWVEPGDGSGAPRWFGPGRFETMCRRKDGGAIWCEVTINGFEDADLGWCWVAAHHDVTKKREAELRSRSEREQLGHALHSLPALAWTADRALRCTLLFDNLVDVGRADGSASGSDTELFGPALASHINELNRRVLVTRMSAQVEVKAELNGDKNILLTADPIRDEDGALTGVAGSALERSVARSSAYVRPTAVVGRRSLTWRRRAE